MMVTTHLANLNFESGTFQFEIGESWHDKLQIAKCKV